MASDLKTFLLWVLFTIMIVGIIDTVVYDRRPMDNEEENQIIKPSYDHNSLSVVPGKQEQL